jgi:hypothetical protein
MLYVKDRFRFPGSVTGPASSHGANGCVLSPFLDCLPLSKVEELDLWCMRMTI